MKKFGVVGHGPGSANVLAEVARVLEDRGHMVKKFPFSEYASEAFGETALGEEEIWDLFDTESVDILLAGTGSLHETERVLPVLAKKAGVLVVSFLDTLGTGNAELRYYHLPDYIVVANWRSKRELIEKLGIEESRVLVFGNPYLEKQVGSGREDDGLPLDSLVYASEPDGNKEVNDTTERSKQVIRQLVSLVKEGELEKVIIGTHPRESNEWVSEYIKGVDGVRLAEKSTIDEVDDVGCCVHIGSTVGDSAKLKGHYSFYYRGKGDLMNRLRSKEKEKVEDLEVGFDENWMNWVAEKTWG